MSAGYVSHPQKYPTVLILFFFILTYPVAIKANSKELRFHGQEKTIVINPGHGGYDTGAQGSGGTLEKTITLKFARVLAAKLAKTYRVTLTRSDDYWVDIPTRTAIANHAHANMFISIHTGGSFLHQATGISIYYYKETSKSSLTLDTNPFEAFKSTNSQALWHDIQKKHQKNSKILAQLVQKRINGLVELKTEIEGAPLMVLEGADMPAILIEIGYISNPVEEKLMGDIGFLSNIAEGVKNGIDDFFKETP